MQGPQVTDPLRAGTMSDDLEFTRDPTGRWSRAVAARRARRLAPGIYTTDVTTPADEIVRRELWRIVAHELPDAVITDRTARHPVLRPDAAATVFCAHPHRRRRIDLPGATIVARPGAGALTDDPPFRDGTRMASEPRALLENARRTRRSRGLLPSTLTRTELADWIAELAAARDIDRVNRLRDRARAIADELDLHPELDVVDRLIGAALGTRPVPTGAGAAVTALHSGRGYDQARVRRFDDLAAVLSVADLPSPSGILPIPVPQAFFEAYFSNYIEGTDFTVDEAIDVVFENATPASHPAADAHDVRSTFALVTDAEDARRVPVDFDELLALLQHRHQVLMSAHPEHTPGAFKRVGNQAAGYVFVAPELVEGTLEQSVARAFSLPPGLARAIYWMFVLAEVHPFSDGNGRIARLFMNAELSAVGDERIIIPTVFRYEYLNALRLLSVHGEANALVRVCDFGQLWTSRVDFSSMERALEVVGATNALVDPERDDSNARLALP